MVGKERSPGCEAPGLVPTVRKQRDMNGGVHLPFIFAFLFPAQGIVLLIVMVGFLSLNVSENAIIDISR